MFDNSGRLFLESEVDTMPTDSPLKVISCGHYMLVNRPRNEIWRPKGRQDYQLLYVHAGRAHFQTDGEERLLKEGQMLLYHPFEEQHYWYALEDGLDLFWVHFTGASAAVFLNTYGFGSGRVFDVQCDEAYAKGFDSIIQELQFKRPLFSELCDAYCQELLCRMSRGLKREGAAMVPHTAEVEEAVRLFHTRFHQPFSVEAYAASCNMSACWFTRQFRRQMGVSPQQYLIEIRMGKAKELLTHRANIGEVGALVGYQDPLYFSRMFKKYTGYSPKEYRRQVIQRG